MKSPPFRQLPFKRTSVRGGIEPLEARIAPALANPFPLASVDGVNGFHLSGLGGSLFAERPAAVGGDVNGDGFEDAIFGATGINAAFVVFGKEDGFPANLDLTTLNGTNGFRIDGTAASNQFGRAVSAAGDLNGDGFADIVVGASNETIGANAQAGAAYVIFGKVGFGANFSIATLDGANGFKLSGVGVNDVAGGDVGKAGDLNGDGFDDVVVSSIATDVHGSNSGTAYVVFGKPNGFAANLSLGALTGANGFRINGTSAGDFFGASPTSAGDVNGDGLGDLIVGAPGAAANGAAYVIFGRTAFAASVEVSTLNGANGFRLRGAAPSDGAGFAVAGGGDVNGDGFADVVVGAASSFNSGAAYVVFGKATPFAANVALATLDGTNGFRLLGEEAGVATGYSVHLAGDVNGDGFDDVIVSAPGPFNRASNATVYVVYGRPVFGASIALAGLDGVAGVKLLRAQPFDSSGSNVGGGDINGDGFEDILSSDFSGGAVVFGAASPAVTQLGDKTANTLTGGANVDILIGGAAGDTLLGNGGADVLRGGQGDDLFAIGDLTFRQIHGGLGMDTLRLDGAGHSLDLTKTADTKLTGIERIDLTGSGTNTLTLDVREVLNLSPTSNTLTVLGDADDRVNFGAGWIREANQTDGATTLEVFTSGAATLRIAAGVGHSLATGYLLGIVGNELPGLTLNGVAANDQARITGSAGDLNGDGSDDFLVGAPVSSPNGANSGEAYVIFGRAGGFTSPLELSTLNGTNGFAIRGGAPVDILGFSGSAAGDFNGDGFGDIIVGARLADGTQPDAGAAYLIYGKGGPFAPAVEVAALDGTNGFKLRGISTNDAAGQAVHSAGDVNGDGFDDVVIGAPNGKTGAITQQGRAYVVFGRATSPGATFDLAALNGMNGFRIVGTDKFEQVGTSVGGGDVNGDGFSDVIVGSGAGAGKTFVVFGKATLPVQTLTNALNGVNGFTIDGTALNGDAGASVSAAGDVNGDGLGDLLIGAPNTAGPGGLTGAAFVVFGKLGNTFGVTVNLATLNGVNGFRISGKDAGPQGEYAGESVSAAGDVNGDGFDDVIVGAAFTDSRGMQSGEAYVVYGKASGFTPAFSVAALDGTNGFALLGDIPLARAARSVSTVGDVNGDGFDDLLIGSYGPVSGTNAPGRGYLVLGFDGGAVTQHGDANANTLTGTSGRDVIVAGQGNDTLLSGGTGDVLRGGQGDDVFSLVSGPLGRLNGGHGFDRLTLNGGLSLDLTARPVYRITGFEEVDLRPGVNGLSLDARAIVNLSPDTNTLIVRSDASDIVNIGKLSDWTAMGTEVIDGDTFTVLKQGQAILKVSSATAPIVTLVNATTATYTDVDGDLVTIRTSKGTLGYSDFFLFSAGVPGGAQLAAINLGDDGNEFRNSDLTISAARTAPGGDGRVNVGRIDATGVDLGNVTVEGDLGRFNAGDAALTTAGVKELNVGSLGLFGTSTQGAGGITDSSVQGEVGTFNAQSDFYNASFFANSFGTVNIGGSMVADGKSFVGIATTGSVGAIKIGGDVRGGPNGGLAILAFDIGGNIGSLSVGGSLAAGVNTGIGAINAGGMFGPIAIGGDFENTKISAVKGFASITIGGSVLSSRVLSGFDLFEVARNADATIGAVTVGGDWVASSITDAVESSDAYLGNGGEKLIFSGSPAVAGGDPAKIAKIASIAIKGEVLGTPGGTDFYGFVAEEIGSFSVGGTKFPLLKGAANDLIGLRVGATLDVKVREVKTTALPIEPPFTGTNGTSPAITSPLTLGALDGNNGFQLNGPGPGRRAGISVHAGGDVNGDGLDDLIIGATDAAYVIFGTADGFNAALDLATVNGINGFELTGDGAGRSLGVADVNGDGFSDVIVGTFSTGAYVVFGKASAFDATTSLSTLDGKTGFKITGTALGTLGFSVSGAGDINGDGVEDVIIGDYRGINSNSVVGAAYVVFGKRTPFTPTLNVENLTGTNGFKLIGAANGDRAGISVSDAGDVNGDGIADVIVGASEADPHGEASGKAYVIYGKKTPFVKTISLGSLTGANGFALNGVTAVDQTGYSVSGAGDVNGDGFDDVIIGQRADASGLSGSAYVVFGHATNAAAAFELGGLNGTNGFRLDGSGAYAHAGISVSNAGDVNGDGFADLVVGAYGFNNYAGAAYIVYGKGTPFSFVLGLDNLSGNDGAKLLGSGSANAGHSVSSAGDINGDGYADVMVGAFFGNKGYVVFGGGGGVPIPPQVNISADLKTATFTDVDGDLVTVRTSAGGFVQGDFTLVRAGKIRGAQLQKLDLSGAAHGAFAGANITISATRGPKGGDGFVNVGQVQATGLDLGLVRIEGDLGQIDAGDGTPAKPALASLAVHSLGRFGLSTQSSAGIGASIISDLAGGLGALAVKSDVVVSIFRSDETIGALTIGGSLRGGSLFATGDLGAVKIGQSVLGGTIESGAKIAAANIAHSFLNSTLIAGTKLGPTRILGDLTDSRLYVKGNVLPATNAAALAMASLTFGGSVVRTNILAGYDRLGSPANPDAQIGPVAVVRDWIASNLAAGDFAIPAGNAILSKIASITINGQALGTVATGDHFDFVAQQIGSFKIGATAFPLVPGASNDAAGLPVGTTGDLRVRET